MPSDNLSEIIQTLTEADYKAFRVFLQRNRSRRERKDIELFNLLCSKPTSTGAELLTALYGSKPNRNAYHALRNRLLRQLTDFVMLRQLESDAAEATSVMGKLALARYYFGHESPRMAWKYLRTAEKMAAETEQLNLLESIYALQLEQSLSRFAPPLQAIIDKRLANQQLLDEENRADMAYAIIKHRLREHRLGSSSSDLAQLVVEVLDTFALTDAVAKRPKITYRVLSIVRSGTIATKEFYHFEPFIISSYQALQATGAFGKSSHLYKLHLLYMIAHTLYRNRKFAAAQQWLGELHQHVSAYDGKHEATFWPRYVMLLAACESYSNNNQRAIELLNALRAGSAPISLAQELNTQLNLAVYHFQQTEYKAANSLLVQFGHTDAWYAKKMGREWVLKKNLIELITLFELGHDDLAENRIRTMQRNFSDLFEVAAFRRVPVFLYFIKRLIEQPNHQPAQAFAQQLEEALVQVPPEHEDLQAMAFYAWLKAKAIAQPYYQTLLQVVQQ